MRPHGGTLRLRPLTGTLLADRFRLQRPLARGGMGDLWLAEHLGLGTEVVVKFISAQLWGQPAAAERFAREAATAARVNSPHVVKILDYGASADRVPFIVMEKLEGRDLAAYLQERGSLSPDSVARIVRQLAKALTKTHAAGIVHRDIKPANVFLCATEGEIFVKLLDFGIAKTLAPEAKRATMTGMCVGTAAYMSPEQMLASKQLDFRADLWSLGVLTFHCLTGRRPFNGDTPGAVLLALRTLALPKLTGYVPALPQRVDGWFARACALEPEARFGSAREMGNALLSALGVALEPLTPDVEEAPLPKPAERGNPSSTAGVPTVVLDGPTRSAAFPAEGDSFLLAPMTGRSPRAHPQRPVLPLLLAALAGIALTGAAYVGGKRQSRPPDVASTPAVAQASASRLLRTDAPLPGRQVDLPKPPLPQLMMETKTANLGPPPSPSPPQPHAPTLPKLPRGQPSRGGPPAPSAAAPSAGVPAATDSAEEPATKPPALAPSASSDEGASHLQGTHNLGF